MSKDYGGDRMVEQMSQPYADVKKKVEEMKASGKYSEVEMTSTGGIYAVEKGKAHHKPEEKEAAKHMAKAGYQVTLKDETGDVKTPDGYVYSFTFEQRTANVGGARSVMKALEHAKKKTADVAVIYDKHYVYHRDTIEHGLSLYEHYNSYRFKRIIVISKSGNVYEHSHN
ncbi:MAG: hypothetical protein J6X16_08790 [Bacteroidales bacterium]|nr:hypothetical protein [Bacteroidales bacterium]